MDQKPTVGRIVHYKRARRDTSPWPAMIVFVDMDRLILNVNTPGAIEAHETSSMAENFELAKEGEWCWPPKV